MLLCVNAGALRALCSVSNNFDKLMERGFLEQQLFWRDIHGTEGCETVVVREYNH
jgi:hypothetical protein